MVEKGENRIIKSFEQLVLILVIIGSIYAIFFALFGKSFNAFNQIIQYQIYFVLLLITFYPILLIFFTFFMFKICIKEGMFFNIKTKPMNRFIFVIITFISILIFLISLSPFILLYETSYLAYGLLIFPPISMLLSLYLLLERCVKVPKAINKKITLLTTILTTIIIYIEFLFIINFPNYRNIIYSILIVQVIFGLIIFVITAMLIKFIEDKLKNNYKIIIELDTNENTIIIILLFGYLFLLNFIFSLSLY